MKKCHHVTVYLQSLATSLGTPVQYNSIQLFYEFYFFKFIHFQFLLTLWCKGVHYIEWCSLYLYPLMYVNGMDKILGTTFNVMHPNTPLSPTKTSIINIKQNITFLTISTKNENV